PADLGHLAVRLVHEPPAWFGHKISPKEESPIGSRERTHRDSVFPELGMVNLWPLVAGGYERPHSDRLDGQPPPLRHGLMLAPKAFRAIRSKRLECCPVDVEGVQQDHGSAFLVGADAGRLHRSETLE